MGDVVVDVITRGLDEAIANLKEFGPIVTKGVSIEMEKWYNQRFKKTSLRIIKTGRPADKIPKNVGGYAKWKKGKYGFDHGLGILTGKLYDAVADVTVSIKETRGKEVRFSVFYKEPYYIAYVIDGTKWNNFRRRPFPEVARDQELPALLDAIGGLFEGLDLTQPTPKLISTVITHTR